MQSGSPAPHGVHPITDKPSPTHDQKSPLQDILSPRSPRSPYSVKRDSGFFTDVSPASISTSTSRHFSFDSTNLGDERSELDDLDEDDEELSSLGAVGGIPCHYEVNNDYDDDDDNDEEGDVFLSATETAELVKLQRCPIESFRRYVSVSPATGVLPSRPIPIPRSTSHGHGRVVERPSSESALTRDHRASPSFALQRNLMHTISPVKMYGGMFHYTSSPRPQSPSRSVGTQTPTRHSAPRMVHLGPQPIVVRPRHYSDSDSYNIDVVDGQVPSRPAHTDQPLPDLVASAPMGERWRSASLPDVPAIRQPSPEVQVGRELRRISDEFHLQRLQDAVQRRRQGGLPRPPSAQQLRVATPQPPRQSQPSSYPGDSTLRFLDSLCEWFMPIDRQRSLSDRGPESQSSKDDD